MRNLLPVVLATALLPGLLPAARADDDPQRTVARAIRAQGGAAALARLGACQIRSRGTCDYFGLGPTGKLPGLNTDCDFEAEALQRLPGQHRAFVSVAFQGIKVASWTIVLNRDEAWIATQGKTRALQDAELKELQDRAHEDYVTTLAPLLTDGELRLSALGEVTVKGRPAVGVKVRSKGRKDVLLYFDPNTGLLVKSERRSYNFSTTHEDRREIFYSRYRDFRGIKVATKQTVYRDGNLTSDEEITDVEFPEIDDGDFKEP
jgi:hypothetical protein